jgi:hypothetical protein
MNCSDAQNYGDMNMQGQQSLADILSHNYTTPYMSGTSGSSGTTAQQNGPYAQGSVTQQTVMNPFAAITPLTEPQAMTLESLQYLNAALRTQIGRKVTISFLIGTNTYVDRTGMLLAVGANYLIINEVETDDLLFCDFFTIKFVKVYR